MLVAGKHQFFPKRELETIEYSIEDTYQGLYKELRGYIGKGVKKQNDNLPKNELTYARYGLWHYVHKDKQKQEPYVKLHRAGANLHGLIRILLFKRFESSVFAFQETVNNLLTIHERFLIALTNGIVPAGDEAQIILYDPNAEEERDLTDALAGVSEKYRIADFNKELLQKHFEQDIQLYKEILELVEPITPEKDAKLQTLKKRLHEEPLNKGKRLIFTQYADTARYLFKNLKDGEKDIDVIYSGDKSKTRIVGRFAPKANPEYRFQAGETELNTVIATDILAEGLNLQDCNKIMNYDLHWNPVRLIQRFGRIDRIGSEHDKIYGFNFLPETGIERNLGLREKLRNRIQEIHDTIGEDAAILDSSERINEEAMYAIYEKGGKQLSLFEDEKEEFIDLNEAEEILRQLRKENPAEYERITNLRDGIRTSMSSTRKGLYVFCEDSSPGHEHTRRYQQLFVLDEKGNVVSKEIAHILSVIQCTADTPGHTIPKNYNADIMRIQRMFAEEVKHRQSEFQHSLSLTQGQKYILRELRIVFEITTDEDTKGQINTLEKAFRRSLPPVLNKELNVIKRNGITGENLLKLLAELYLQYNMRNWADRQSFQLEDHPIPRVICSEKLV